MIDLLGAAIGLVFSNVLSLNGLFDEIRHGSPASNTQILRELSLKEKAGVDSDNVEELRFPFRITELLQSREGFCRDFHGDITPPIRSSPRSADLPR